MVSACQPTKSQAASFAVGCCRATQQPAPRALRSAESPLHVFSVQQEKTTATRAREPHHHAQRSWTFAAVGRGAITRHAPRGAGSVTLLREDGGDHQQQYSRPGRRPSEEASSRSCAPCCMWPANRWKHRAPGALRPAQYAVGSENAVEEEALVSGASSALQLLGERCDF